MFRTFYELSPFCRGVGLAAVMCLFVFATGCPSPRSGNTYATPANTAVETTPVGTPAAGSGEMQLPPPEDLVSALYKAHDASKSPFFQTKDRALVDKYFTKQLADLIWKDATTSKGEIGAIDADPLYDAQDLELKNFAVGKGVVKDDSATVAVTFTNFGEKKTLKFLMNTVGDAWKIDNIDYGGGSTLLGWLKDAYSQKPDTNAKGFEGTFQVGPTSCTVKMTNDTYEVRWLKGSGVEKYLQADGNAFEAQTDKGVNRFEFNDESCNSGTFYRDDGKTFPIKRVK